MTFYTATPTNSSNTLYISMHNDGTTEAPMQVPIAGGTTLNSIAVRVTTAPGAGTTWTFTLRKNGLGTAGNVLSCAITGAATQCTASGSVTFAAGDLISAQAVNAGTIWGAASSIFVTARFN